MIPRLALPLLLATACGAAKTQPTLGTMVINGVTSRTLQVEIPQSVLVELVPAPPEDCASTTGCAFSLGACVTYEVGRDGTITASVSHAEPPTCTTLGWQHYSRPGPPE